MGEDVISTDFLEAIINLHEIKTSVKKVVSGEFNQVNKGEHQLSDAYQMKLIVIKGDGRTEPQYFFMKRLPTTPKLRKFVVENNIFPNEIKFYNDVIPLMNELLHSTGDYTEKLWPQMIGNQGSQFLLLEDLMTKGYATSDRHELLDFEHSSLVLKALAKFHSLSAIINKLPSVNLSSFNHLLFIDSIEGGGKLVTSGVKEILASMDDWGPGWNKLKQQLKINLHLLPDLIRRTCVLNSEVLNVLNHGDMWINNIFFGRNNYTGLLNCIKFVDYQMVHYNSYAMDIQYFLNTSVHPQVRKQMYNDLLQAYHSSLAEWLTRFNYERIPSFNDVELEMKKKLLFGVVISVCVLGIMQVPPEIVIDMETVIDQQDILQREIKKSEQEAQAKEILEQLIDVDLLSFI